MISGEPSMTASSVPSLVPQFTQNFALGFSGRLQTGQIDGAVDG